MFKHTNKSGHDKNGNATCAIQSEEAPELNCVLRKRQEDTFSVRRILKKIGRPPTKKQLGVIYCRDAERHFRTREKKDLHWVLFTSFMMKTNNSDIKRILYGYHSERTNHYDRRSCCLRQRFGHVDYLENLLTHSRCENYVKNMGILTKGRKQSPTFTKYGKHINGKSENCVSIVVLGVVSTQVPEAMPMQHRRPTVDSFGKPRARCYR